MNSKDEVQTSIYVTQFVLEHYSLFSQYDAAECLISILNNVFESPSTSPFTIDIMSKIWCSRCSKQLFKAGEETYIATLNLIKPYTNPKSIEELFNIYFDPSGTKQEDYRCDCCRTIGHTNLAPVLNRTLNIFESDMLGNSRKILPNLLISEEIHTPVRYVLQGVIWHIGGQNMTGMTAFSRNIQGKFGNTSMMIRRA